jgi:uncharacterized Ntn-hydrolase superfamily protein
MNLHANTFSIVAHCPLTGQLGIAISTAIPGVGGICPFICSNIGAVSTQSWVNPYLAFEILDMLKSGATANSALEQAISTDDDREQRQLGVVDASGRSIAWTGAECTPWAGQIVRPGLAIQGNMLIGENTLIAMETTFSKSTEGLSERLMCALEAGQIAGGDMRGKQSAALKVYASEEYPLIDLRVDEHAEPVKELRRVLAVARTQLAPFIAGMPGRLEKRYLDQTVKDMLLLPPDKRTGDNLGKKLRSRSGGNK